MAQIQAACNTCFTLSFSTHDVDDLDLTSHSLIQNSPKIKKKDVSQTPNSVNSKRFIIVFHLVFLRKLLQILDGFTERVYDTDWHGHAVQLYVRRRKLACILFHTVVLAMPEGILARAVSCSRRVLVHKLVEIVRAGEHAKEAGCKLSHA